MRAVVISTLWVLVCGCDLTGDLVYETPPGTGGEGGAASTVSTGGTAGQGGAGGGGTGGTAATGWTLQLGAEEVERSAGIALRGTELLVAGDFFDRISIGGETIMAVGDTSDAFVALVDAASGAPDEANIPNLAAMDDDSIADVAFFSDGSAALGGHFRNGLSLPGADLVPTSNNMMRDAAWIARLDADLDNGRWSTSFESGFGGRARLAHLWPVGEVLYVAGTVVNSLVLPNETLSPQFSSCDDDDLLFLAAVDGSNGDVNWAFHVGSANSNLPPLDMAVSDTHVYAGTNLDGTIDFSCTDLTSNLSSPNFTRDGVSGGGADIYLYIVDQATPSGDDHTFGSPGEDRLGGVATAGSGVWVTGAMSQDGDCGSATHQVTQGVFLCHIGDDGMPTESSNFIGGSLPPHTIAIDGDTLYIAGDDPILFDFGGGEPRAGMYIARFNIAGGSLAHEETTFLDGSAVITELLPTTDTLYMSGELLGHLDLGPGTITTNGATDIFVTAMAR